MSWSHKLKTTALSAGVLAGYGTCVAGTHELLTAPADNLVGETQTALDEAVTKRNHKFFETTGLGVGIISGSAWAFIKSEKGNGSRNSQSSENLIDKVRRRKERKTARTVE